MVSAPADVAAWAAARRGRRTRALLQNVIIFPLLNAFCRVEVHGADRIKGFLGPAIFVSNHASALDGVVMVQALPRKYRQRSVVVVAADSIFKRKWEAKLAQVTVNAFPIPRGGGARPALDRLKELIADRWSVVIFPEGRLSVTGAIGTFKKGAAILAIDAGVPIVPAYTEGLYEVLPRFRRMPHPGSATVTFGDPLAPSAGEDYDSFVARVEQAVRTLAGPKGEAHDLPAPVGSASAEGPNYWY
jgi:1-acyl-sn-glycerol-3-phosphate acyltransferase